MRAFTYVSVCRLCEHVGTYKYVLVCAHTDAGACTYLRNHLTHMRAAYIHVCVQVYAKLYIYIRIRTCICTLALGMKRLPAG